MRDRAEQFRALYRRLRIDDQRKFYEARSREYGTAHRQAVLVRNALLLLAALAGVAAQFTSGTGRAGCGVVASILAALAGAVTGYESLIGFPTLHKLYGDAALSLAAAAVDWDAAHSDAEIETGIERVEQILRTENGQWGQLVVQGTPKEQPAHTDR
jgi:SMODS and SLOG-associating 2TM effector domain 1